MFDFTICKDISNEEVLNKLYKIFNYDREYVDNLVLTVFIQYNIKGRFKAPTLLDPAEYPEVEVMGKTIVNLHFEPDEEEEIINLLIPESQIETLCWQDYEKQVEAPEDVWVDIDE